MGLRVSLGLLPRSIFLCVIASRFSDRRGNLPVLWGSPHQRVSWFAMTASIKIHDHFAYGNKVISIQIAGDSSCFSLGMLL